MPEERKPNILYELTVNTLNFCSFSWCWSDGESPSVNESNGTKALCIALPHTLSSEAIDIYELSIPRTLFTAPSHLRAISAESPTPPTQTISSRRLSTIPAPTLDNPKTGLTMCLAFPSPKLLFAGYEGGQALVYSLSSSAPKATTAKTAPLASTQSQEPSLESSASHAADHAPWTYSAIYLSRPHTQPVLSLAVDPSVTFFVTTSADALLARHRIPHLAPEPTETTQVREEQPESMLNTKHSGQQGVSFRDDGMLLATAGWDGRGRVYRAGSLGRHDDGEEERDEGRRGGNESAGLPGAGHMGKGKGVAKEGKKAKRIKELAVLKWHKEGCYSMGFAHIFPPVTDLNRGVAKLTTSSSRIVGDNAGTQQVHDDSWTHEFARQQDSKANSKGATGSSGEVALRRGSLVTDIAGRESALVKAKSEGTVINGDQSYVQRREDKARNTHWLAMGSKDGRVSLWDIF